MNKWIKLLIILIVLLLMASAVGYAVHNSIGKDDLACMADAKICPDGSYVSRNPDLDCEFNSCPTEKPD